MQRIETIIYEDRASPELIYVYLHGAGGFGDDSSELFKYRDFPLLIHEKELRPKYPFIVLHALDGEYWNPESVNVHLEELSKKFDHPNIHLIGYSRGGYGVYQYLSEFSLASRGIVINSRVYEKLSTRTPIDVYHAVQDDKVSIECIRKFVKVKSEAGQIISLHEFEGDHHSIDKIALSGCVVKNT